MSNNWKYWIGDTPVEWEADENGVPDPLPKGARLNYAPFLNQFIDAINERAILLDAFVHSDHAGHIGTGTWRTERALFIFDRENVKLLGHVNESDDDEYKLISDGGQVFNGLMENLLKAAIDVSFSLPTEADWKDAVSGGPVSSPWRHMDNLPKPRTSCDKIGPSSFNQMDVKLLQSGENAQSLYLRFFEEMRRFICSLIEVSFVPGYTFRTQQLFSAGNLDVVESNPDSLFFGVFFVGRSMNWSSASVYSGDVWQESSISVNVKAPTGFEWKVRANLSAQTAPSGQQYLQWSDLGYSACPDWGFFDSSFNFITSFKEIDSSAGDGPSVVTSFGPYGGPMGATGGVLPEGFYANRNRLTYTATSNFAYT